jgi:hypothetical protein
LESLRLIVAEQEGKSTGQKAIIGHTAEPPSSVMNSRSLASNIRLPSPQSAGRDHDRQQMKAGAAGLPLAQPTTRRRQVLSELSEES